MFKALVTSFILFASFTSSANSEVRSGLDLLLGFNKDSANKQLAGQIQNNDPGSIYRYVETWKMKWHNDQKTICQRPALYEFLRSQSTVDGPSVKTICPEFTVFSLNHYPIEMKVGELSEIQYLISGAGKSSSSQFGHAMMRLVFCSSQPCNQLNSESYDIGFSAQTENGLFSLVGGLEGTYSNFLNVTSDSELKKRLLYDENRDITSVPLKLSEQQKHFLFYLVIERFWTYAGEYKFLKNNCASEVLKLLQIVFTSNQVIQDKKEELLTPSALQKTIIQAGLANPAEIKTVFSQKQSLEKYLADFEAYKLILPVTMEGYCESPSAFRRHWITSQTWTKMIVARWELLEETCHKIYVGKLVQAHIRLAWNPKVPLNCSENRGTLLYAFKKAHLNIFPPALKTTIQQDSVPSNAQLISQDVLSKRAQTLFDIQTKVTNCGGSNKETQKLQAIVNDSESNLKLISSMK